mmetsp:Transcript_47207/g.118928  ORF Transcript_47207/g.118928 Transcript_47207/m.118928 type:complete len:210 (-) Transcript_47207:99-728(-)
MAIGVYREGHGDLEGLVGVDATCSWAILLPSEVEVVVAHPPSIALSKAVAVPLLVQCRVPGVLVRLLDVDLMAIDTADGVGVAVVVHTAGDFAILSHGDEVHGSVATTTCLRQLGGVGQLLSQKLPRLIVGVVVGAGGATLRKVGPAPHLRKDVAAYIPHRPRRHAGHVHLRRHHGQCPCPCHADRAKALLDLSKRPRCQGGKRHDDKL